MDHLDDFEYMQDANQNALEDYLISLMLKIKNVTATNP